MSGSLNSMQRVLTAVSHQEADKVPLMLLFTVTGARFSGCSIENYFADAELVAEAQIKMQQRYRNDCYYGFYYASAEIEAFGGQSFFFNDGPPNAAAPFIRTLKDIDNLRVPEIESIPVLQRILKTESLLKAHAGENIPIIGVVMSPFSLPVMQMGFESYLNLIYEQPQAFEKLMQINQAFCIRWAKAQLEAGATAICYFDPVSSPTVIPPDLYLKTGFKVAQYTLSQINAATATHLASGRCINILPDIINTGTNIVGVSVDEDLAALKKIAANKIALLGNLNAIEMRRWSAKETENKVKKAIKEAAVGGGFLLADNHGEIPWQISDEILMNISDAVERWGHYPLNWLEI